MDELLRCVQHVCTALWLIEIVFPSLFLLINLMRRLFAILQFHRSFFSCLLPAKPIDYYLKCVCSA